MTPEAEKALRYAIEQGHNGRVQLQYSVAAELLSLIEGQRWQPMVNPPKTDEFWLWDGKVVTKVTKAHQSAGRNSPMEPGYIRWDTDEFFTELHRDWKFIEIHEPTPPTEDTDVET